MILELCSDPRWLSNSYLVADRPGGTAILIDGGAPPEPLLEAIERDGLSPTHLLCTHRHPDHVANNGVYRERFGCAILAHRLDAPSIPDVDETLEGGEELVTGGLSIRALHVPGHTAGQLAFLVNGSHLFTGDTLFRGSVGGTRASGHTTFEELRHSIMATLMTLPHSTEVFPGHTESTTIGREWEENPFIRAWRGLDEPLDEPCHAYGEAARLLVRARDYDGGTKCWVRFEKSGQDDIVPGSGVSA